jgi:hypothetical protein
MGVAEVAGLVVRPAVTGTYHVRVIAETTVQLKYSHWHKARVHNGPTSPTPNCTPRYSPCLVNHGGADYHYAGRSGNGPYYAQPGTSVRRYTSRII